MAKFSTDQRELGDAIVARLAGVKLGGEAKRAAAAFKQAQAELAEASDAASAARLARDEALATVSKADVALDTQISRLADRLVGESLGKRSSPFAAFAPHSPSDIQSLRYGRGVVEVRKLVRAIERTKPRAAVHRTVGITAERAQELQKALDRLAKPQTQYTRALARRDALLPGWQKALDRLRILARAALVDDPTGWKALFAQPGAPKPKRKKKKAGTQPTA